MSALSNIEITDQFGNQLMIECVNGADITASIIPRVGSANGGVPSVEIDETDRKKLRAWLSSVMS